MPRLRKDYSPTEPDADGVYSIDFAANVPPGATLESALWELGLHYVAPRAVSDPTPERRLVGDASVSGSIAMQRIAGLIAGNDYLVTCTGTMSDGEKVVLWTVLPCRTPS